MCDGKGEARDGVRRDERAVGFDDRERVVVDGEADGGEGARVDEAEAVGLVCFEGELGGG